MDRTDLLSFCVLSYTAFLVYFNSMKDWEKKSELKIWLQYFTILQDLWESMEQSIIIMHLKWLNTDLQTSQVMKWWNKLLVL